MIFSGGIFDWDGLQRRFDDLSQTIEDESLWEDADRAQALMRERARLEQYISMYKGLGERLRENKELLALADEEGDEAVVAEVEAALQTLRSEAYRCELESLLSGDADSGDTYLEIHAGAGGTEGQDWAAMLLRMYMRWSESKGYRVSLMSRSDGEEAGIKSVTLLIEGLNAHGWLKTESGVHRLVRISPFDANSRRHTSFASVWVYPVVEEEDIEIDKSEVRVDTYRSSGAGGQHVNTTDSAVRLTHMPSGIVVQCQNERSQHKNNASAWKMLHARLREADAQRRREESQALREDKGEIGWGKQIRSYVLQPYQKVKDLRTSVESGNPSAVLDGDLDAFMEAALAAQVDAARD